MPFFSAISRVTSFWVRAFPCLLVFWISCAGTLSGQEAPAAATSPDIHVDPSQGSDAHDGRLKPVKTIARAIKLAQPGDTIHLTPGTYFESADFYMKHGLPGRPITLDGHGAVLEGSDPVKPDKWESLGGGLFRKVKLLPRMDDGILMRWYFIFDGKVNRMSRCSKGPTQPLKEPAALQPGEWTYVKGEDAFYLKLAEGTTLDAAKVRAPVRSNGVSFSRDGSHLTIRNLTATHVYNDGFNIHGAQRTLRFENIAAIDCGDDGFSAHEDAECQIEGFTSIGNATGLCDTGTSRTHYRRVYIRDCVGFDLFFIGAGHSLEQALVESSAVRAFSLDGSRLAEGQVCTLRMRQVWLRRVGGGPQEVRVGRAGALDAEQCTFTGLNVQVTPGGSVALRRSLLDGELRPEVHLWVNSLWRAAENHYDITSWRVGQQTFPAAQLDAFRRLVGGETGSTSGPAAAAAAGIGAEKTELEMLRPASSRSATP